MIEKSSERIDNKKEKFSNVQKFMGNVGDLSDAPIKAEFDTWSWYYGELSTIRNRCSQLGSLVRLNNSDSYRYIKIYYSEIYSLIQLVVTLLPYELAEKIRSNWNEAGKDIEEYLVDRNLLGSEYTIPPEIQDKLRLLHDAALKIAQEMGMGVRTTISDNTINSLKKTFLGE